MRHPPPPRRVEVVHADEDGLSAGAEALVFGVLVFVVGAIIVLNGWAVLDAKFAVNAAAREATRTIVEGGDVSRLAMVGDDDSGGVGGTVRAVAAETMAGHGKDTTDLEVRLTDSPWRSSADRPDRCARVTVQVHTPVRGIEMPFLGGWGGAITVTGEHSELVDPFRSGLTGSADCG